MDIKITKGSFINDIEKMGDFPIMTKARFLESYSYLTEDEYDATMVDYIHRDLHWFLQGFVGQGYCDGIYEKIKNDVVEDIQCCSGVSNGEWYNDDDMRLAVGRALCLSLEII